MTETGQIPSADHVHQIEEYTKVHSDYEAYAKVLKRVFEAACRITLPEALVQSRAKTVSSFAEKVVRKFPKYTDAVRQFTDLCGARVIVQTSEQVMAVRSFIEDNFVIVESDDKGLLLSTDKFGYRDMHYIVQLKADRRTALGISASEAEDIADHKAEIQVRTWLQHAWADTLHDRIYKNKLSVSSGIVRTGALLAALMEEGDRIFNQLAEDLDGMIVNYTAFATREKVEQEIVIQELIIKNEPTDDKKPALALNLARLRAAQGDHPKVVDLLDPHSKIDDVAFRQQDRPLTPAARSTGHQDANRFELLLTLGYSRCRMYRGLPTSEGYKRGVDELQEAVRLCDQDTVEFVPHLRRRQGLRARALSRLAWALDAIPSESRLAREYYYRAHDQEPSNPYYLAGMLGFEMRVTHMRGLPDTMRATIREAIATCRQHALSGIELPWAYFTAARLNLFMGNGYEAMGEYALGVRYCLAGSYSVPADTVAEEVEWLGRLHYGYDVPPNILDAIDLLKLGQLIASRAKPAEPNPAIKHPHLILAGGAGSMDEQLRPKIQAILENGLRPFGGIIISGGTNSGVPGCLGDVASEMKRRKQKGFDLVGYTPARLPRGVLLHDGYDRIVELDDDFSPRQVLGYWSEILGAGVNPTDVLLLGFGGGPLSAIEYRIALGLGAAVGVVSETGGSADALLKDPLWSAWPNLYPLPFDPATIRAFIVPSDRAIDPAVREKMGESFHREYVKNSTSRLPENMKPWPKLKPTYRRANLEQASYAVEILQTAGFVVSKAIDVPTVFSDFTSKEVEQMAEMEHGRWNIDRLRDAWRFGKVRDNERKLHDCLVPWDQLPEDIKQYDRQAVMAFPRILAEAGMRVEREADSEQGHA